jgi:hypothetical protein
VRPFVSHFRLHILAACASPARPGSTP